MTPAAADAVLLLFCAADIICNVRVGEGKCVPSFVCLPLFLLSFYPVYVTCICKAGAFTNSSLLSLPLQVSTGCC